MSQYHVVEPGAFHTEPNMPRFHDVWNSNHQSRMWGGQKQKEKLGINKITQLGLLGVEWDKDSITGKLYDVKTPFHTAVGHFEDIRTIHRQSGKKKNHPIVWRIQITSEPHDSKYLKRLEKLADKDTTTTEQIPETDGADKKEGRQVQGEPRQETESVKAMKEKQKELLAEKEESRVREAAREALLREHQALLDDAQNARHRGYGVGYDSRSFQVPNTPQQRRQRGANGPGTTVRTVTYENNPEPDRYAVDDYNYAM